MLETIDACPGLSIQELAETLGMSRGAVRHHLTHLTRQRAVTSHRQGAHVLLFPTTMPALRRKAIFLLRIESIRAFVEATIDESSFRMAEVADEMGLNVRSARRGFKTLQRAALVRGEPMARGTYKIEFHPEMRIAWVLYAKNVQRRSRSLNSSPGWLIGFELLLAKLGLGAWAAS